MGDRQDIDALLMGALYGELDAADQARLEAHLASHPGDRAAMDSLAETRSRVRDQLATMPQAEPAPAISTLILQEAARRAPRKASPENGERGLLAWLSSLFQPIARHPALAGALALVLVGGAAGVLYQRGKVDTADHSIAHFDSPTPAGAPAPATSPSLGSANDRDRDGMGDVADKNGEKKPDTNLDSYQVQLADRQLEGEMSKGVIVDGKAVAEQPSPDPSAPATKHGAEAGHPGYVTVTRPARQPKTIDDHDQVAFYSAAGGGGGAAAGAGSAAGPPPPHDTRAAPGGGAAGNIAGDDVSATTSPTPRPTATVGAAPTAPGAPGAPGASGASGPSGQNEDAKVTEWAAVQHKQMVVLVKAGNCSEAGRIGSAIAAKAPEYYAANVENDRAVRGCKQYIDQAKRKKANEAYKSRARDAAEPDLEQPAAN